MKKIISISLTLLLLLGNLGFTYGTHFCGGHAVIQEIMLGEARLDCGMGMHHPKESETQFATSDCCSNEYVSIETGEIINSDITDLSYSPVIKSLVMVVLYTFDLAGNTQPASEFSDTSPPLPKQDKYVLHQVFII